MPIRLRHLLRAIACALPASRATGILSAALVLVGAVSAAAQEPALLPAEEAARTMRVPPGFEVTLFAGEPDVQQPIGFCVDDRGRLWVAEAYNYPVHGDRPGDRIVILEDRDRDGRFDRRTVFYDKLNYVTGIEVGFGGARVVSPPSLYFIPDRDQDDVPDGDPQVLLDGFGNHANSHNLANGLAWGPDGWLYGTHGRTNWSLLGKPGTPPQQRRRFDGGVYRYHPVRHQWEPYADGTTNPWGIDWNDYGEAFVCNCVNPHVFHVIHGAHYEPWRNRKSSEFAYQRIPTIADHLHFVGSRNVRDGLGSAAEDAAGGGHAHCGLMIYLGGRWPQKYRSSLFTNNVHGRRINNDTLATRGASFVAGHGPDFMRSQDPWFVGVTLAYGPEGEVYVSDWSDIGECHYVRNTQKQTGRIYRIQYGAGSSAVADLKAMDNQQLAALQGHTNDWWVRHARRLLHERHAAGAEMAAAHAPLHKRLDSAAPVPQRLRALWALHVTGGLGDDKLLELLRDPSPDLRSWGVRLLCEDQPPEAALQIFAKLAAEDESARLRLHLASCLQRLPPGDRWPIAEALCLRAEDEGDATLPLMIWYAVEPLVHDDLSRFVKLAFGSRLSIVRRHAARRIAELDDPAAGLQLLASQLGRTSETSAVELLSGVLQGLAGRRTVAMPAAWPTALERLQQFDAETRELSLRLALVFDDPQALRLLAAAARDVQLAVGPRQRAVEALVAKRTDDLPRLLLSLARDPAVRGAAVRGLAEYSDPATPATLLQLYPQMNARHRQDVLQTLAARKSWAATLLAAVEQQVVPRSDLTAYTARQLQSLGDADLTRRLRAAWGEVRESSADRARQIVDYRRRLNQKTLARADLQAGQALFRKQCATCHRLLGEGAEIGPDLSGAQRNNLDYLLENLIDPSSTVSKDFQMELVRTTSGRTISGLVIAATPRSLTLQTVNQRLVVPLDEVADRKKSDKSIMPEGLIKQLSFNEVRDLIAYLQNPPAAPSASADGQSQPGDGR